MRWLSQIVLFCGAISHSQATQPSAQQSYCVALARAVDASAPGNGPTFVASYQFAPGSATIPAAVAGSAFTYDNALAAIALIACGDTPRAMRIADAISAAVSNDRTYRDGRVRNAYAAGPFDKAPDCRAGGIKQQTVGTRTLIKTALRRGTSLGPRSPS
jgi:hypothetical protein